jgi:hypothetical protein
MLRVRDSGYEPSKTQKYPRRGDACIWSQKSGRMVCYLFTSSASPVKVSFGNDPAPAVKLCHGGTICRLSPPIKSRTISCAYNTRHALCHRRVSFITDTVPHRMISYPRFFVTSTSLPCRMSGPPAASVHHRGGRLPNSDSNGWPHNRRPHRQARDATFDPRKAHGVFWIG